jgi:ribose 5-phosphate isomerase RpiB
MTLPNDEFVNCELTIEELETIAAGGFWSTLKHIASDVGIVAGKIGVGLAIGLRIFGGVSAALGGPATSRNANVN